MPEHSTDALFLFTFVFKQALSLLLEATPYPEAAHFPFYKISKIASQLKKQHLALSVFPIVSFQVISLALFTLIKNP